MKEEILTLIDDLISGLELYTAGYVPSSYLEWRTYRVWALQELRYVIENTENPTRETILEFKDLMLDYASKSVKTMDAFQIGSVEIDDLLDCLND